MPKLGAAEGGTSTRFGQRGANRHDREDERCGDSANDSLPLFG